MLESLRHFVLIAEHGTFTAAARHAHVSQPALTASIRRLEAQLDATLFDRGRHGAELTAPGRALLAHARAAVVAVDEGKRAVRDVEALEAGEVRVGGGSTACTYLLPPVLATFRKKHPRVRIFLRELSEEAALTAFERGELDLLVAGGDEGDAFRDDELVVVAARDVATEGLPFITLPPGTATRSALDRYFPRAVVSMELASLAVVKGSVRAGLGVALLPRSAVATDLALGRLVEVPTSATPVARRLSLVHRGVERLSAPARALRAMLLEGAPKRARRKR